MRTAGELRWYHGEIYPSLSENDKGGFFNDIRNFVPYIIKTLRQEAHPHKGIYIAAIPLRLDLCKKENMRKEEILWEFTKNYRQED